MYIFYNLLNKYQNYMILMLIYPSQNEKKIGIEMQILAEDTSFLFLSLIYIVYTAKF